MKESAHHLRILLVEDKPGAAARLTGQLHSLGHQVVGLAQSNREAVEDVGALQPDLVLVALHLDLAGIDGITIARTIFAQHPLPLILVVGHDAAEFVPRAREAGIMALLVTSSDTSRLAATIESAIERYREFQIIRPEVESLHDALVIRNEIEQAKRLLMRRLPIPESEAFQRLWRARTAVPNLRELAPALVRSERLLGDGHLVRDLQSVLPALRRGLTRCLQPANIACGRGA